jgi:hypothetical protein
MLTDDIVDQLSVKVTDGWNEKDTTYVQVDGKQCIVSLASLEDKRMFERKGRWIYPGVLALEFNNQLYRVVW